MRSAMAWARAPGDTFSTFLSAAGAPSVAEKCRGLERPRDEIVRIIEGVDAALFRPRHDLQLRALVIALR